MNKPSIYKHYNEAAAQILEWKKAELKIVFTNGCFDVLHIGHLSTLRTSKALGDILIVGLNTDSSIRVIKGKGRPVQTEMDRALLLSSIRYVDAIIFFDEETPEQLIRLLKPDIITKGGDYHSQHIPGANFVESYGGKVCILDFLEGYSSSQILNALRSL